MACSCCCCCFAFRVSFSCRACSQSKWKISFQNIFSHLRNNIFVCFLFFLYYSFGRTMLLFVSLYMCVSVCVWKSFVVCPIWFLYMHCCSCWALDEMSFSFQLMCLMASAFTACHSDSHTHTHIDTHTVCHTYANFDMSTGFAFSVIKSIVVVFAATLLLCATLQSFRGPLAKWFNSPHFAINCKSLKSSH